MASLVLASASPARARLLARAGVPAAIQAAVLDEGAIKRRLLAERRDFEAIVLALAEAKATVVAAEIGREAFVIGCDQALIHEGTWFDKARDRDAAAAVLGRLQGRRHDLISAVVVAKDGQPTFRHVARATLGMRPLTARDIDAYLTRAGPGVLGAVGCYHLEGIGVRLFDTVEGDFFTILGLPLLPLLRYLREEGVIDAADRSTGDGGEERVETPC